MKILLCSRRIMENHEAFKKRNKNHHHSWTNNFKTTQQKGLLKQNWNVGNLEDKLWPVFARKDFDILWFSVNLGPT